MRFLSKLARFDRLSHMVAAASPAPVRCSDRDDQIFVDLAVANRAMLLSRDRQVLRLRRRLAMLGVTVGSLRSARLPDKPAQVQVPATAVAPCSSSKLGVMPTF